MAEEWRLLDLEVDSANKFFACRGALLRAKNERLTPDTLALFSIEMPAIGAGAYSDIFKDINLDVIKQAGFDTGRGPACGGPIYIGHESYYAILYLDRKNPKSPPSDEVLIMKMMHSILDGISMAFKVPCRYRPLNDGEIWDNRSLSWKKLCPGGIAGFENATQTALITQIGEPPMDIIQRALTPPAEKFADKAAKTVAERVAYLEEFVRRKVTNEEMRDIYIKSIEQAFDIELVPGKFTEKELEYIEAGMKLYASDEWLYGRTERKFGTIPQGVVKTEAIHKVSGGPLLRVTMLTEKDAIRDILFTGTMHASPMDCFIKLEESLKGVAIDEGKMREKVREMYNSGVQTPMITEDIIVSTVMEAATKKYFKNGESSM
jgi:lipoate-protein ligase A